MSKNNWPTKKLGEICKIRTGKKDVDEGNPEGKYPFFTCSREITYSDTYSFDTEAILIAGNGDVGNTKIYKGKFEAYQRTYVLDGFQEDIKYIYYYLIRNLKRILIKSKFGSTMPYIRKGDLENFKIPLPPLPIQQKIVKILDTIQSAVEIQEKIIEKTKELKKSLMAELFKYGSPSFRRGRKLKKTEIGEIPENWEVVRFRDEKLFELIMGQSPPSSSYNQNKKGLPFLQGKAEFGEIYPQPIKWCDKPIKVAEKNDILISVRAPVGDLNLADQKYCIGRGLAAIRLKNNVDSFFMFNCLNFFKNQILTYGTGSTFKAITKEILENFKIPLPPLPEQQEIAEILQTIDQKIEIEKKKKELYEELFKTMLNKIMNQEINVEKIEV
jgi:type I restriction enzyme S subunit